MHASRELAVSLRVPSVRARRWGLAPAKAWSKANKETGPAGPRGGVGQATMLCLVVSILTVAGLAPL